ncbi:hypothetical protein DFH07DRAFT_966186 [Mycena maculata]|uniref:Uncharacterized protein n=1 Tax=Mycena maculata TaxID=230809 RepID=A0AAD7I9C8_9AGAR|nr:hypothetical protein DFH07DRAFT_966186 [Mycena maculata]
MPSSNESASSGRSAFCHPRPAPPTPISRSATPEGFVVPRIPPSDDPLIISHDAHGHRQLPRVSNSPLSVEDARVKKLIEYQSVIRPKCSSCAEMAIECSFTEAGIPCPSCAVLGIPDCDWVDPFLLMENLQSCRNRYLRDERDILVKAVEENRLSPSLFEREFNRVQDWFYSGAQGTISRFMINSRATCDLAIRGYRSLAASSVDISMLSRVLSLGAETQIHPLVLQVIAEPISSCLSQAGEDVVRKLFKTIRATRYEDPVDQDAFLTASAKTLLSFRPQVTSFATVPALAECVFNLRSMMHSNNSRIPTPISETFIHIQDFAGEIIRKRQLIRERKHAQIDRIRADEGAAARNERRIALEHANRVNSDKAMCSPDEDAVSIPSTTDESGGEDPPPKNPPASPIAVDLTNNPANHQACHLSPLHELQDCLRSLSLNTAQPSSRCSPSSQSPSLPDLVPDFTLQRCNLPVKGGGWERGRTKARNHKHNFSKAASVVQCHSLQIVPRPFGLPPNRPKHNFVDDWLVSKPNSTASRASKRRYTGNSSHFNNPNHHRRPVRKNIKHCYHCWATDHLIALCPLREIID